MSLKLYKVKGSKICKLFSLSHPTPKKIRNLLVLLVIEAQTQRRTRCSVFSRLFLFLLEHGARDQFCRFFFKMKCLSQSLSKQLRHILALALITTIIYCSCVKTTAIRTNDVPLMVSNIPIFILGRIATLKTSQIATLHFAL